MKKLLMYFFFLGLLFLSACSKDDSLMYCCDPSIDSWVKNNLDELEGLSRAELVMNGVSKTKAAYRVFKPEKRAALWLEKLSNYIELKRNAFSHEEKKHIEKLRNFISPEIFATESRSEINNAFIKYWISYAETNLGWSKLQIAEIAFTLRVPTEFNRRSTTFDDEVKFRLAPGGGGGGSPTPDPDDCSCSYDASCFLDNISAECNDNADCDQTMIGCGFLWLYPCVGLCEVTQ